VFQTKVPFDVHTLQTNWSFIFIFARGIIAFACAEMLGFTELQHLKLPQDKHEQAVVNHQMG